MMTLFPSKKPIGREKEKIKPHENTSPYVGKVEADGCNPKKKSAQ
jgi:hypothetical protein